MGQIEKTVFISYRRTNLPWALAIYQNLTSYGYDVFLTMQVLIVEILNRLLLEISKRAHISLYFLLEYR